MGARFRSSGGSESLHWFLDASMHLYKRVCPSVGPLGCGSGTRFFNEPIMTQTLKSAFWGSSTLMILNKQIN